MPGLPIRQIEYAVAMARHGGVTAAAEALHVSQPALSVALGQLEAALGQTLFLRRPGGRITPTAFGRGWLAEAERQIAALTRLMAGEAPAAPLRLAVFEDLAPACLGPLFRRPPHYAPDVTVDPRPLGFEALAAALSRGQIDLALTWDLGLGPEVTRTTLIDVAPHAVLAPDHPLAARARLTLAGLAPEPLILADQGLSLAHFRGLFARDGHSPRIAHRPPHAGPDAQPGRERAWGGTVLFPPRPRSKP